MCGKVIGEGWEEFTEKPIKKGWEEFTEKPIQKIGSMLSPDIKSASQLAVEQTAGTNSLIEEVKKQKQRRGRRRTILTSLKDNLFGFSGIGKKQLGA